MTTAISPVKAANGSGVATVCREMPGNVLANTKRIISSGMIFRDEGNFRDVLDTFDSDVSHHVPPEPDSDGGEDHCTGLASVLNPFRNVVC